MPANMLLYQSGCSWLLPVLPACLAHIEVQHSLPTEIWSLINSLSVHFYLSSDIRS